jgi:hypothetical protein
MDKKETTFVIEVCENCRAHTWNTRHDENKYKSYALESKFTLNSITLLR